ncbi:glycosyltransferase family 2 protein [Altericista sp. CCNU0014]|uniref:glycosyltransferase family 2 protein n=1 Tax=Altericista sp. CCNU0014 TaxID=3082949 RepID=UPI00384E3E7F
MGKPTIICLTPVRNEAWILDRFLQCASLWADHIILADQSTDNSAEIASRYPKVTVVRNPSTGYNEAERQKLVLDEARKIPGPRLLITLDADEAFTANFTTSPEWQTLLDAPMGTAVRFKWCNLMSDLEHYWQAPWDYAWGFMDDGSEPTWSTLHTTRIPAPLNAPDILMRDIKVMHFAFTDDMRRESKWRWYQCFERVVNPHRSAIELYRQYHEEDSLRPDQIRPIPSHWMQGYVERGIDMTSVRRPHRPWWDKELVDMLDKYGAAHFRRQNIWTVDWDAVYREIYGKDPSRPLSDPRNKIDKWVHRWLRSSQAYYQPYNRTFDIRYIERFLKILGW